MAKNEIKDVAAALKDLQDVDALGFAIIGAAGVAGLCGFKGPLTTIVMGLESSVTQAATGVTKMLQNPIDNWESYAIGAVGGPIGAFVGAFVAGGSSAPTSPDEQKAWMRQIGQAAANMVEAGLLYQLARNPETLQTLFDMSKEAVKGATGLAKTGAALLKG